MRCDAGVSMTDFCYELAFPKLAIDQCDIAILV